MLGSCWRSQSEGSWGFKIFQVEHLNFFSFIYLEGGEVGNLETGSLEFEVLEPDLLE